MVSHLRILPASELNRLIGTYWVFAGLESELFSILNTETRNLKPVNGLEKTLERKLPERDRRWHVAEESALYGSKDELCPSGWPVPAET